MPTLLADLLAGHPISFDFPELKRFNFEGGGFIDKSLIALWLALSFYTASYIAENVRAGILAVSRGQTEAAAALGMRPNRMMSLVVLPQALRVIIPPLISQYLNLTKNSSLAIAVGYMDARATLGGITMNQTGRELECMLLLMGFYLIVSLLDLLGDELVQRARRAEGALRWPTLTFVRDEMLPAVAPPAGADRRRSAGRARTCSPSWLNSILTILSVAGLWWLVAAHPALVHPLGLERQLAHRMPRDHPATWGEGVSRRLLRGHPRALEAVPLRLLPEHLYWRPTLAFVLMFVALAPILVAELPRKLLWFSMIFPGVAYWLLWGGTICRADHDLRRLPRRLPRPPLRLRRRARTSSA